MSCDVNSLLLAGRAFQGCSEREQMTIIAQLLCDISGGGGTGFIVVFPTGVAIGPNGAINTSGTTTCGIQEAINSLSVQTNYVGPESGGGYIYLAPGVFNCSGQITIPNNYPFDLTVQGSGKMRTLLNYTGATDFVITERAGNPVGSAGYGSLNLRWSDTAFTYQNDTNKAALWKLTYVNELIADNCAFATLQSFKVPGFGANLVYIDGTPTYKVGTVGAVVQQTAPGNIAKFTSCAFYGLAAGLDIDCDHIRVSNTIFANIGVYWPTGRGGIKQTGSLYTVAAGATGYPVRSNNCYANGFAFIRNGGIYECHLDEVQWFHSNICAGHYQNGFSQLFVDRPFIESSAKGIVAVGDDASQAVGEIGGQTFATENGALNIPGGGYMDATTGILSGTNPLIFGVLSYGAVLEDSLGEAGSLTFSGPSGTIFSLNNNGLVHRNLTKVQRNALASIRPGQIIYQTDNTPGLRTWNGSHWVQYTESNDD